MANSDAVSRGDLIVELADVHLKLASAAGPVNILRGIDLSVGRGETVSVVGPSGSGKSTMMMIMAGLERPTSGLVRVAGHDLGGMDEDKLARFRRDHVGIVFQAFHLSPTMTALENVAIPLEFAGRADAFERAHAGLEAVGLRQTITGGQAVPQRQDLHRFARQDRASCRRQHQRRDGRCFRNRVEKPAAQAISA
jgi:putative ABC transport system ATP-binding protein